VHAGGAATGAEIERALVEGVRTTAASLWERWFAVDLVLGEGARARRCRGVAALDPGGVRHEVLARHTLLASGGAGQLFAVTTNPAEVTGDGVALAMRAHVPVADLEFVQFHPTALHHPRAPRPLLSEALRGHGALIRDARGERFVDELASRDVVSRAMAARMADQGVEHLWLDATPLERFHERFPTIATALAEADLDPATDWLPIAPAAHYLIGGVVTDLDGASALPGLWAAGEVACTGVHGANRLGSNSLLEGMVFAGRVVEAVATGKDGPAMTGAMRAVTDGEVLTVGAPWEPAPAPGDEPAAKLRAALQDAMSAGAGVLRDAGSLARADTVAVEALRSPPDGTVDSHELANLAQVARGVVAAAAAREESRGCHARRDFPEPSPAFARRLVQA
jgi:L-aspartate oxidase